jgi:serine/threonine protein kinase
MISKYNPPMTKTVSVTSFAHSVCSTLKDGNIQKINQYNLTGKIIKEGSFGTVFKAIDSNRPDKKFAIKIISKARLGENV